MYENSPFRFTVSAVNHTTRKERIRSIIESFSYMAFLGPIELKTPEVTLSCLEECMYTLGLWTNFWVSYLCPTEDRPYADTGRERYDGDGNFRHVYFGRLVCMELLRFFPEARAESGVMLCRFPKVHRALSLGSLMSRSAYSSATRAWMQR
jgi:hypothetical protein